MKAFRPEIIAFFSVITFSVLGCTVTIPVDTSDVEQGADQEPGDTPVSKPPFGGESPDVPAPTPSDVPKPLPPEPPVTDPVAKPDEVALQAIVVTPANGGINPAAKAFLIQAEVQLGGNGCEAQGRKASIGVEQEEGGGKALVIAKVSGGLEDRACPAIFKPVFAKVSITVRGEGNLEEQVFIKHAKDLGSIVALKEFLSEQPVCEVNDVCPANFDPVVCAVEGAGKAPTQFGNLCQAQAFLKRYACEKELEPIDAEAVCKPAPLEE